MVSSFFEICEGPIPGLRLPRNAWLVLEKEDIKTLDQLRAVVPRTDRLMGIGPRTAHIIREELARVAMSEQAPGISYPELKGQDEEAGSMPDGKGERLEGPIRGLRLPLNAWAALRREGITTIGQLRAVADQLETIPDIGPKSALLIREELARVTAAWSETSSPRL